MARVIGPGHGMARSSTELTAETSAAVPHTNISSATYRSVRARLSTTTSMPRSRAMVVTESWVMPSSAPADAGGVINRPPRPMKMFSPVHSLTQPWGLSMTASS
jgi:hypothetical protein